MPIFSIIRGIWFVFKLIFVVLLLLVISGGTYIWYAGDDLLKRLTPKIEEELARNLNAQVKISNLSINLYPRFGAKINGLTFKPNNSCTSINAGHGSLYIDPIALIHGQYIINYLSLGSVQVSIPPFDGTPSANKSDSNCEISSANLPPQNVPKTPANEETHSSPISLSLNKLELEDIKLLIEGPKPHTFEITHFESRASFKDQILELALPNLIAKIDSVPVELKAELLRLEIENKTLSLNTAVLSIFGQQFKLQGKLNSQSHFENFEVAGKAIELNKIRKVLQVVEIDIPAIPQGITTFTILANSPDAEKLSIKGDVKINNLNVPAIKLTLGNLDLKQLDFLQSSDNSHSLKTKISIGNFSITDEGNLYVLDKTEGALQYKNDRRGIEVNGQLDVTAFGFNDGVTNLKNASGRLANIKATRQPRGEIKVTSNVDISNGQLIHPVVNVNKIDSVNSPLTVEISREGRYSVSGLVTGKGGDILLGGRDFNNVGCNVQMLVSGPLKEFKANPVSAKLMGRTIESTGTFSMTSAAYLFQQFQLSLNGGNVGFTGKVLRDSSRALSADIAIKKLPLDDLISLVEATENEKISGTIGRLDASLGGNMTDLSQSINGKGSFEINGSTIEGFDLSRTIGNVLKAIPFANLNVSPDNLSEEGGLKTAEAEFSIANKIIDFSNVVIYRPKFKIKGSGKINFEKEVDAKATVIFAQETMKTLGAGFERLGNLMGRIGKVEIPLFVRGRIPDIHISPDLVTLARDNSGITLVGDVLGTTYKAGRKVTGFVLNPFGIRNQTPSSEESSSVGN